MQEEAAPGLEPHRVRLLARPAPTFVFIKGKKAKRFSTHTRYNFRYIGLLALLAILL